MNDYQILINTILQPENFPEENIRDRSVLVIGDADVQPDSKACTEMITDYMSKHGASSCAVLGHRFDPLDRQPIPENVEWKRGTLADLPTAYGSRHFDIIVLIDGLEKTRDLYAAAYCLGQISKGGQLYILNRTPDELSAGNGSNIIWYEDIWRFEAGDMKALFPHGEIVRLVSLGINPDDSMRWVFTSLKLQETVTSPLKFAVFFSCAAGRRILPKDLPKMGYFKDDELESIGQKMETDKASANHNYLDKYEFLLAPMRDKAFTLLELGVFLGASERMWQEYFPHAQIIGVDIAENCRNFADERINILIRDLSDETVLKELAEIHPRIIVDDASHLWSHQIKALFSLFSSLPSGGIYILEDMETSFFSGDNSYADYAVDAYTICERIMRVSASKLPDRQKDEFSDIITAIGMAVEMAVIIKGSCILIRR